MRKKFICPRCETFVETDIDVDGYAVCPKCENDIYLPYFRESSLQSRVEELQSQLAEAKARLAGYEWIPVSERLPEDGVYVLISDEMNGIYIAEHISSIPQWSSSLSGYYRHGASYARVTHWMPLPEAPKGGEA